MNYSSIFEKAWEKFQHDYKKGKFPIYNESDVVHYLRWYCQDLAGKDCVVTSHYSHGNDIRFQEVGSGKVKLAIEIKMSKHKEEAQQGYLKKRLGQFKKDIDRLKEKSARRQRQGVFVLFDAGTYNVWKDYIQELNNYSRGKVKVKYFPTKQSGDGFYPAFTFAP